jgi:hypothetical protein
MATKRKEKRTHFLNGLRTEHIRPLGVNTNTILNPNPHTPEMLRVPVIGIVCGYVYTPIYC